MVARNCHAILYTTIIQGFFYGSYNFVPRNRIMLAAAYGRGSFNAFWSIFVDTFIGNGFYSIDYGRYRRLVGRSENTCRVTRAICGPSQIILAMAEPIPPLDVPASSRNMVSSLLQIATPKFQKSRKIRC